MWSPFVIHSRGLCELGVGTLTKTESKFNNVPTSAVRTGSPLVLERYGSLLAQTKGIFFILWRSPAQFNKLCLRACIRGVARIFYLELGRGIETNDLKVLEYLKFQS